MPIFKAAENKKCRGKGGFKTSPRPTLAYITNPKKAAVVSSIMLDDNKNYAEQFADTATPVTAINRPFGKSASKGFAV